MNKKLIFPQINKSFNRGTHTHGDVLTQTPDGRDLNEIWAEIQATLEMYNTERQALVNLLTFPVTNPIEDVAVAGTENFEKASEFGVPKSIRVGGMFQMGYDFDWFDIATRYTWKFLADAKSGQITSAHNAVIEADKRNVFVAVLKAVFNNTGRNTIIRQSAINVYPFYNADGMVPPTYKNNTFSGSESHYLVSGASTVDSGDLDDMMAKVEKKGYGPDAGNTVVLLVNSAEAAVIRNFRVTNGDQFDFIPAQGQPSFLVAGLTGIQGGQIANTYGGLNVIGNYGDIIVIKEDFIPASYMFLFSTGGDRQLSNPIGLREHENSSLNGLQLVSEREGKYPLVDSYYVRGFGTGVRHRGAGVVMQVKASGSYTIPTAFAN